MTDDACADDPWADGPSIDVLRQVAAEIRPNVADFDVHEVTIQGVAAEWVVAEGIRSSAPVVLYLHGGALLCGQAADYRNLTVWLSRIAGVRVLALNYRLAPEHPFPAAMDDALVVYRALLDQGLERIAVAGDSAGAALAVTLAADAHDAKLPLPACIAGNSPYADLSLQSASLNDPARNQAQPNKATIAWLASTYLEAGDKPLNPTNPRISPVFRDLTGLPPLLIQTGGLDNLQDDGNRLAWRAHDCGVLTSLTEYPKAPHIWPVLTPAGEDETSLFAVRELSDFINKHTN